MKTMRVFAPAKINLYLHILKRLGNGYHALDSLISFADIGDYIEINHASEFSFHVEGEMSGILRGRDLDPGPQSGNLVVKAAWRLARLAEKTPNISITLTKNLPAGAGIGGGSSDAASVIWGLCTLWDIPHDADFVIELLASLGADVPVCFEARTAYVKGVGEHFKYSDSLPEMPIVLVYPGKPCATATVFSKFSGQYSDPVALPHSFKNLEATIDLLKSCCNDLLEPALKIVPDIDNSLRAIEAQSGCLLSRMSGSGSCCFGIFNDEISANNAAKAIAHDNPDWWVKPAWLGRVERY